MAKRFTDTDKWKKGFLKGLPIAYKLFWLYICDDCSNMGIWETSELGVVKERTGQKIDLKKALELFNHDEVRVHVFDNGKKWFLPGFIIFQYGADFVSKASKNRLIDKVHEELGRLGLIQQIPVGYPLERVPRQEQRHGNRQGQRIVNGSELPTWKESAKR